MESADIAERKITIVNFKEIKQTTPRDRLSSEQPAEYRITSIRSRTIADIDHHRRSTIVIKGAQSFLRIELSFRKPGKYSV
jgi:hypothetical protein